MRGGGKNSPSWRCGGASRGCLSTRGKEVGQRMLRAREGARPGGGRAQGRQTLFACRRGNIVNARAFGGQFWASQSTLRASPWVSNDMAAQAHPAFPQVAAPCTHSACETSLAAQGAEVASSKGAKCAARRRRSVVPRGKGRRRGERGRRERRETLMARVCVGGQCGVDVDKNHSGVFVSLLMCPSCPAAPLTTLNQTPSVVFMPPPPSWSLLALVRGQATGSPGICYHARGKARSRSRGARVRG